MFDESDFGAAETVPAGGADDFAEETDAEAAAICLSCRRARCLLDDGLPCRRYHRELRKLRERRQLADITERGEG